MEALSRIAFLAGLMVRGGGVNIRCAALKRVIFAYRRRDNRPSGETARIDRLWRGFSKSRTAVMLSVPLAQLEEKTHETHHRP